MMRTPAKRRQSLPPFDWAGFERAGYAGPREFPKVWGHLMDDPALFETYLTMGGRVHDWHRADPLELALGAGDFFRGRLLVEHGRDFSALQQHPWGDRGHLPLWFSLFSRWSKEDSDERMEFFDFLVEKGLDVNQSSNKGADVAFLMAYLENHERPEYNSLRAAVQTLTRAGFDWTRSPSETGPTGVWVMVRIFTEQQYFLKTMGLAQDSNSEEDSTRKPRKTHRL
jgi:hypothetical protein